MDGDLLLWVAAGYSGLLVICVVWVGVALSTHRTRHRRQLERYEQRLRSELEVTYANVQRGDLNEWITRGLHAPQ